VEIVVVVALLSNASVHANPPIPLDRGHRILIERGLLTSAVVFPNDFGFAGGGPNNNIDWNTWNDLGFNTVSTHSSWIDQLTGAVGPRNVYYSRWSEGQSDLLNGTGNGTLSPQEVAYIGGVANLAALQAADEENLNDTGWRNAIKSAFDRWKVAYPDTLVYTTQNGPSNQGGIDAFQKFAKPDMSYMFSYEFKSGGSLDNLYKSLRDFRLHGMKGVGTTDFSEPIPYGMYFQAHNLQDRHIGESEMALGMFAPLAYGFKKIDAFVYSRNSAIAPGNDIRSELFEDGGDSVRRPLFDVVAENNRQIDLMANTLVRLNSTGVYDVNGESSNITDFSPFDVPFVSGISASDDVVISQFEPLDESFDGTAFSGQTYFMLVNANAPINGTSADASRAITLDFDFGATGITELQSIDLVNGGVEVLPLTPMGGSLYSTTVTLDGGRGKLFKYNTGAPFVGAFLSVFDAVTGDYNSAANWNNADGPVPWGYDVTSHIANGGTAQISADTPRVNKLFVGTLGSAGTVNQTAGDVRIDTGGRTAGDENWLFVGQNTDSGTYNQSGGSVTAHKVGIGQFGSSVGTYNLSGSAVLRASAALSSDQSPTPLIQLGQGDSNATGVMTVSGSAQVISDGFLDVGNLGHGTLTQNGPSTVVTGVGVSIGRESGSDGTLNVNGGSFTAINELAVGRNGTAQGTVNQSGGTVSASWAKLGGHDGPGDSSAVGNYNLTGGTLAVTNELQVGGFGTGTFTQDSGSVTTGFWLGIGQEAGSTGTYNLNGGTISVGNGNASEDLRVADNGSGTFNQTGGSIIANNWAHVGAAASGVGSYNMSGGTFQVAGHLVLADFGNGTFTQNSLNGPSTVTVGGDLIVGHNTGSTAAYNMAGGSLAATAAARVGVGGSGTVAQTGGSVTADRLDVGGDVLVAGTTGTGVYNMSGGTLSTVGGYSLDTIAAQPGSTGTLNLSGTATYTTDFLIVGDNLFAFPVVAAGGDGTLSITVPNVSLTTLGLWIGATGTLEFNSGSGLSTIQTTLDAANSGGTFLMGGDLVLDLSTLVDNSDIVLVENLDSTALVSGTFFGLPEGAVFQDISGTKQVQITYVGGIGGNDIVLSNILNVADFLDADFDTDGDVDNFDLIKWEGDFGVNNGSDADVDGDSDGRDFLIWQRQQGVIVGTASALGSSVAVPEPSSLVLMFFAILFPTFPAFRFALSRAADENLPIGLGR